ncbi:hypothetical protein Agabi119p4_4384 [Agaricus bisporus var. burnettii]|uniref:RRN7-type domain-containing protein n=1 Tax=Agaricus bisporus var. burnettii TaxID=192524 RepID=A0A8H7F385_AGABI|nr:hypothetical protein Agabi119p4_4384 [Agaricus bisporus var. burnettii]
MAPRRRCPTCGSREWHKEPLGGLIACSEGHVLQNYRSETNEADDYAGPHMTNKRKLKNTKEKKERGSKADPQLYHGARGRYHYFLCQQLILRMQVEAITKLWSLPPEFEAICRDIWGLHVSLLANPPPAEPYLFTQEGKKDDKFSIDLQDGSAHGAANSPPLNRSSDDENNEDDRSSSGGDSEMEELLRENSEISSSSEEEGEGEGNHGPRNPSRARIDGWRRTRTTRSIESLASTLAVLVVAFWQLRIPIMYQDLMRVIASYKLPYLDPVRLLPLSVSSHLTKHNSQALSPHRVPNIFSVHKLAARLSKKLYATYGVFTPECNAAPLLWRLTKDVGQTPTLYALAKQVAYILELPLTLHSSLAPGVRRVKAKDSEGHKYDNVPPEVALMATIIIVVKMAYGLDGKPRIPIEEGDPVVALPRIDEWRELLKNLDDGRDKDKLFSSESDITISNLDDGLLDEYLGFCQHALLGQQQQPGKLGSADDIARNLFPVEHDARRETTIEVEELPKIRLRAGKLDRGLTGEKAARPGESYAIWNSRDAFGTLASEYGAVVGGSV